MPITYIDITRTFEVPILVGDEVEYEDQTAFLGIAYNRCEAWLETVTRPDYTKAHAYDAIFLAAEEWVEENESAILRGEF